MADAGALRSGSATDASTDGARPADRVSTSTAVCTEARSWLGHAPHATPYVSADAG